MTNLNEVEIGKLVIRFTPTENDRVRALLVALGKNGKEYTFQYYAEYGRECEDLIVNERDVSII